MYIEAQRLKLLVETSTDNPPYWPEQAGLIFAPLQGQGVIVCATGYSISLVGSYPDHDLFPPEMQEISPDPVTKQDLFVAYQEFTKLLKGPRGSKAKNSTVLIEFGRAENEKIPVKKWKIGGGRALELLGQFGLETWPFPAKLRNWREQISECVNSKPHGGIYSSAESVQLAALLQILDERAHWLPDWRTRSSNTLSVARIWVKEKVLMAESDVGLALKTLTAEDPADTPSFFSSKFRE